MKRWVIELYNNWFAGPDTYIKITELFEEIWNCFQGTQSGNI
jgi:hypothetical protein